MRVGPAMTVTEADPILTRATAPADGIGLCLSGGGYRAMIFHVGVLWRLLDSGVLTSLTRISSVSGGSITAAALALAWPAILREGLDGFKARFVAPVRAMADTTIQTEAVLGGLFLPGSIAGRVAHAYGAHLLGEHSLQDLPDTPRFVFNATNLETGSLFRFEKPYARDYRVGRIAAPSFRLADVVAASSAFAPFLSPFVLDVAPGDFAPVDSGEIADDRFREQIALSDGGVYDNLGLQTVWSSCHTVFVSDGGQRLADDPAPHTDWARHMLRVLDVIDHQVRNLRKQQVVGALEAGDRKGAYWGVRTDIADYALSDALACPHDATMELAAIATGLKRLPAVQQERLINWGYAVTDAALRRHYDTGIPTPGEFPYPASGIG